MIEAEVKDFLNTYFAGNVSVCLEIPKNMPEKFIVFQRVDMGREDYIEAVTLEFCSYADSKYEAALLDESLRDAMDSMHSTTDISCKISGGDDDMDTSLKKYRYRCYYNLHH